MSSLAVYGQLNIFRAILYRAQTPDGTRAINNSKRQPKRNVFLPDDAFVLVEDLDPWHRQVGVTGGSMAHGSGSRRLGSLPPCSTI